MAYVDFANVFRDLLIDLISLYFFSYAVLYKRYRNKELFVSVTLFNLFMILVVMAMVRTSFNIAMGFGLFALLSMVQMRSAPFSKAEMAYLFGGVVLAVINGAGIANLPFVLFCNVLIIVTTLVISGWSIEHSASIINVDNIGTMQVTLDHIDDDLNDPAVMGKKLCDLLKLPVVEYRVRNIDYVRDTANLVLTYELAEDKNAELTAGGAAGAYDRFRPDADGGRSR